MPKANALSGKRRHNPLEQDIVATGHLRTNSSKQRARRDDDEDAQFIDSKASAKILKIGRELAEEDRQQGAPAAGKLSADAFAFDSRFDHEPEEDNDVYGSDDAWGDEDEEVEEVEVDVLPEDLDTFNRFLPTGDEDPILRGNVWESSVDEPQAGAGGTRNLADIILAKIAAHDTAGGPAPEDMEPEEDYELPPKVVEVYSQIGMILSRYKSGKLPKPFKILPTLPHWEEIIQCTNPDGWTPNAVYEATRIFISGKPVVAQRFMEMILLPRVREDIFETKKLNVHLFKALKKALYKPSAWFKGFLFPMVSSGTCTLREAHIVGAVLSRVSIPVLHSAAAIKGLCDIAAEEASNGESSGATNIFIKTLLEKKYALPYQVIDALVFHFLRFRAADPAAAKEGAASGLAGAAAQASYKLPVIWHQCLLAFAQRYRDDISEDQREALLDLLLTHGHHAIGPEVRRELLAGRGRGVAIEPQGPAFDGDDTMVLDS